MLDTKNIWFVWFHLIIFRMYYLLFIAQVLSVISEAFAKELICAIFSVFCFVFSFRYNSRIIIKQFNNFFSWFIKCCNIICCNFLDFWFLLPFYILFNSNLNSFCSSSVFSHVILPLFILLQNINGPLKGKKNFGTFLLL